MDKLWRGELHTELAALEQAEGQVASAEAKLDAVAATDKQVGLPGVGKGPRQRVPRRHTTRRVETRSLANLGITANLC